MKSKIQIVYKTEKGTELRTYREALIADRIEKIENSCLSSGQIKLISIHLASTFLISEKKDDNK